jgi:hypothetical protein
VLLSRAEAWGAAAGILLASVLGGCAGETSGNQGGSGAGPDLAAPVNTADCTDWNEASTEQRLATVRAIRQYTGGPVAGTGGTGVVLDDEKAYDLFENYCENEYARGFKLYKLYGRAAAFQDR